MKKSPSFISSDVSSKDTVRTVYRDNPGAGGIALLTIKNESLSSQPQLTAEDKLFAKEKKKRDKINVTDAELKDLTKFVINSTFFSPKVITHPGFNYVYSNPDICNRSKSPQGDDVFLLLMIVSAPDERKRRITIRRTWSNSTYMSGKRIARVFLLANSSDERVEHRVAIENTRHKDICKEDFVDSYHNLTLKTLMGLRWANRFCRQAKFVLKIDSDTMLNMPNLLTHLKKQQDGNIFQGHLFPNNFPLRKPKKAYMKWKITHEEYPYDAYPPYVNGPAYVISGNLLNIVVAMAEHIPYLKMEDAFVGMIMQTIGVTPENDSRFTQIEVAYEGEMVRKSLCYFVRSYTVYHFENADRMSDFWNIWKQLEHFKNWNSICDAKQKLPYKLHWV